MYFWCKPCKAKTWHYFVSGLFSGYVCEKCNCHNYEADERIT